jgi:hypothetical protein
MNEKPIRQRARLAMGDSPCGYRNGGSIGMGGNVDVAKPVKVSKTSPLTMARRNNGIPGMKCGGMVMKGKMK